MKKPRILIAILCLSLVSGCCPSYPKDKFTESIVKICKNEYSLDVKVETTGRTIAIYLPLSDLIDFTFSVSKSASEKINDVILSVSRVALSSDAKFDFYCVIAHDVRIPEIQIVIIKSVDDVKRFLLNDISRSEYSKRMLVDIRLNPQSQKERSIKDVFSKMKVDDKWQEEVINDFFRSEPTGLGDIGYWNNRFYIKDIALSEFLAEQINSRVKMGLKEDQAVLNSFAVKSMKGTYVNKDGKQYFRFDILAEPKLREGVPPVNTFERIFDIYLSEISKTVHSYNFEAFEYAEIISEGNAQIVKISRADLEKFRKKKITVKDVLNKI